MPAIRRGGKDDLQSIARIQRASPEASDWRVEDYLAYDLWVADAAGRIAAFLVGRTVADGECEILNLAVDPEWRRKGIGRGLIQAFLAESRATVYLELREGNQAALNLYKSMGFKEVSRRPGYYNLPPEAAIVMKFHSC